MFICFFPLFSICFITDLLSESTYRDNLLKYFILYTYTHYCRSSVYTPFILLTLWHLQRKLHHLPQKQIRKSLNSTCCLRLLSRQIFFPLLLKKCLIWTLWNSYSSLNENHSVKILLLPLVFYSTAGIKDSCLFLSMLTSPFRWAFRWIHGHSHPKNVLII